MAKYQDTVEILIQARDEARAELQKIRKSVNDTREELGGQAGVVANAAKLHHTLQKVSAAADGIKTGIAAVRGITQGLEGDTEGMVESFKQLGFGIGEVVNQADQLADVIANKIYGITEEMVAEEHRLNKEYEKRLRMQRQQNDGAEKARASMLEQIRSQSRELELLNATSDAEKERIQTNHRLMDAQKQANKLREIAAKDISVENRERGMMLADRITANAYLIEQRKEELQAEKAKTAEMQKQKDMAEQRRDAERSYINSIVKTSRDLVTGLMSKQIKSLRDEASSIQTRDATVSLGSQQGRLVTGLRDQLARREDPMIRENRQLREDLNRKADEIKQQIDTLNQRLQGDGTTLIPLQISAGGIF